MGTGSSALQSKNSKDSPSQRRAYKKSVRGQFQKEFGETKLDDDDGDSISINGETANITVAETDTSNEGTGTASVYTKKKEISINPAIFRAKQLFMKPISKKHPKVEKLVVKKQNNSGLLKEIYRRMDPNVQTVKANFIVGEVELAAKYKIIDGNLLIKVGRAKNLHQEESGMPDPYVVIDILSSRDSDKLVSRKTGVKSNTCDPIFQEIVVFSLTEREIADTRLRVSVWDKDLITQDDFLGETIIELCKLDLNLGNTMWYKLLPRTDVTISGSLDVTVDFQEPNTVVAVIHQAYDLKACYISTGTSNPYVQLYVTGIPNKLETKVVEGSLDPVWDESIEFTVHSDEFSRRIIVLNVMSKEMVEGGRDKRLGDVHIPLLDFEHFGERRNYVLQDLRNAPYGRSKWAEEGLTMEFREAMKAHAIYGYPKFFFKKEHKGKKVVSCHSVKARSEARMIISNGIPSQEEVQM